MVTKEQERKALEQIKKIVDSLGADSYIATAFDGCFEDARENNCGPAGSSHADRQEHQAVGRLHAGVVGAAPADYELPAQAGSHQESGEAICERRPPQSGADLSQMWSAI